jgi:vitamin B12 transporter
MNKLTRKNMVQWKGRHVKKQMPLLLLLLSGAFAAPLWAEDGDKLMELYFDESEMVETASRAPKPINRTAENVTVIKQADIERLNAHSLYEVLDRVAGISVAYANGRNMNGHAVVYIQGSRTEHVLVLLDGVRLNTASSGDVNFATIPVGIIERIEIIKGPASAAWGSSLGGVINILTKKAGTTAQPTGSLFASYGEARTWETNGDAAGSLGRLGYYLYAAHQETDGFVEDRWFEADRLYGKAELPLPRGLKLTATFGYNDPINKTGGFPVLDFDQITGDRDKFFTANLEVPFKSNLNMNVGARRLTRKFGDNRTFQGLGLYAGSAAGDLFYQQNWDEESSGAYLGLTWNPANHQIMAGAEINRGEVSKNTRYGDWAQANWGAPPFDAASTGRDETRGYYLNDTIIMGDWAVTPGIRFDQHSISKDMTSPSLGVTYRLSDDTILRGLVNKGFVHPVLSFLDVADSWVWGQPANPDLDPEEITSYQFGFETHILKPLYIKADLFRHDVEEGWWFDNDTFVWRNGADLRRQGLDLEISTEPVAGFSALFNCAYVHILPDDTNEHDSSSTANLILRYDDEMTFQAELAGHYVWYDTYYSVSGGGGEYGTVLWDLRLTRRLFAKGDVSVSGFFTARNLFNGSQYSDKNYVNPDRWLEGGLKVRF